jgi:hypothetical protein
VINRRKDGEWQVQNRSSNGTLLNQQRHETGTLAHGDTIQLGSEVIVQFVIPDQLAEAGKKVDLKADESPKNELKSGKKSTKKPASKSLGIQLLVAAIWIGMFMALLLKQDIDSGADRLTKSDIEELILTSRSELSDKSMLETLKLDWLGASDSKIVSPANQASGFNVYLSNVTGPSAVAEFERDAQLDKLMESMYQYFFDAWVLESQKRWPEAIERYEQIVARVPDVRITLSHRASQRIRELNDKL